MIRRVAGYSASQAAKAPPTPQPTGGRLAIEDCYAYCEALTRAHHENFPRASRFLPAELRPHVFALYAFARTADDFADEPQFAGRRAEELDRWEDLLHRCAHGEAEHPVFVALAETIARCELPIGPLQDLLTAFRMDLRTRRYATARELHAYTAMAARPIGRLLLYVFGIRSAEHHRFADELSSALALTAFWQDVALDLARDRIYLPQEDLCHFGVTEADLFARRQTPQLGHLLRYECARTRAAFERARPLVNIVPDRLGVEVALMWFGGARALEKIEAQAGDVFGPRVALGRRDKALVLTRALAARGRGLLGR